MSAPPNTNALFVLLISFSILILACQNDEKTFKELPPPVPIPKVEADTLKIIEYQYMADSMVAMNRLDKGLKFYKFHLAALKSKQIFEEDLVIANYIGQFELYEAKGEFELGLEFAQEEINIYLLNLEMPQSKMLVELYNWAGHFCAELGDSVCVQTSYRSALDIAGNNEVMRASLYGVFSMAFSYFNTFLPQALEINDQEIQLFQEMYINMPVEPYHTTGYIYKWMNEVEENPALLDSSNYYFENLVSAIEHSGIYSLKETIYYTDCLLGLAENYLELKLYDQAILFLEKSCWQYFGMKLEELVLETPIDYLRFQIDSEYYFENYFDCYVNHAIADSVQFEKSMLAVRRLDSLLDAKTEVTYEDGELIHYEMRDRICGKAIQLLNSEYAKPESSLVLEEIHYFMEKSRLGLALPSILHEKIARQYGLSDSLIKVASLLFKKEREIYDRPVFKKRRSTIGLMSDSLSETIVQFQSDKEKFQTFLKNSFPDYYKSKRFEGRSTLEEVKTLSIKKNIDILHYNWFQGNLFCLYYHQGKAIFKQIPIDALLENEIFQYTGMINQYPKYARTGKLYSDSLEMLGISLYKKLILPFVSAFELGRPLCLIPDGILRSLPFECLITHPQRDRHAPFNLNYFCRQNPIFYALSESTLLIHQEVIDQKHHQSSLSSFSYSKRRRNRGLPYPDLPGSNKELRYQTKVWKGEIIPYPGAKATFENIVQALEISDIVHLGLHALASSENRNESMLITRDENPIVLPYQLFGIKTNTACVVFSSCDSDIGYDQVGDGIYNIARPLIVSGVQSVITTNWKVNDQNATPIMNHFYKGLSLEKPFALALNDARLNYLNTSRELHPHFWSVFRYTL